MGQCLITLNDALVSKQPIVLKNDDILYPDADGKIYLQNCEEIKLLCSGKNNNVKTSFSSFGQLVTLTCYNNEFVLNDNTYNFESFTCQNIPQSDSQEIGKCNENGQKIQLGFNIITKFLSRITLCFNPQELTTYWTSNKIIPNEYKCKDETTNFKKDFFQINPDQVYKGSGFDRGHLTPRCDFPTAHERRMTFYYVNTSPQIPNFNRNNWKGLESVIRTNVNRNKKELTIYTGTTQFKSYLNQIPVQKYFWKVVIEPISKKGIAFVGVNDDTNNNVSSPCVIIKCDQITWLRGTFLPKMSDYKKGIIYCCTIQNFRNIPNIQLPPEVTYFTGGVLTTM